MPTLTNRTYRTKKEKNDTKDRGYIKPKKYAKYYNSKQWKDLREWYRTKNMLCEICAKEGRSVPMDHVHHLHVWSAGKTQDEKWQLLLDPENLCSLCTYHHLMTHKFLNSLGVTYLSVDEIVKLDSEEHDKL